ncbi:MAG: NAD(P)H-hydrate dehydratase [Synergistaceae bacterium]|jgi:NAD(P)H-hydrate epimerase|nr:NAD(P)H-hydrate dehydratase [Synergistaceae bacterium]
MKYYYGTEAVRAADKKASEELGVPGEALMENAGRAAAEIIAARYPDAESFLVLCGPGNNGGDGFAAARHLDIMGRKVKIIAVRATSEYTGEALFAAAAAERCGIKILRSRDMTDAGITALLETSIVVDALLGVGASGEPRGEVGRLIELSAGRARTVSLDIPSGVDADTGETGAVSFRAELTISFLALKPAHAIAPGALRCGETVTAGIGVKPSLALGAEPSLIGYDASDIPAMFPRHAANIHKGSRGSLLIVGGSSNFRGAPVLSALAALKAGCGLVALAAPESVIASAASLLPEAIFVPLPEEDGHVCFAGFEEALFPFADKFDALVLGPGLGLSNDAQKVSRLLYGAWSRPMLIDADALKTGYEMRREDAVATPHAGEASFILSISPTEVERHRLRSCRKLAEKFGVALLKGPRTLISNGTNMNAVLEGGQELAVPGSGDVLSGTIGAFLAAGLKPIDAATLGAVVHGTAGGLAASGSANGALARDIAGAIKNCTI